MMEQEGLISRLTRAAKLGDVSALAGALADGANANAGGSWPLQCAARRGHVECVRLLLPASEPLAINDAGLDAAGVARAKGQAQVAGMIEAFMEAKALSGLAQHSKGSPRVKSAL